MTPNLKTHSCCLHFKFKTRIGFISWFGFSLANYFLTYFCASSPLARLLFPALDDNLLKYNYDDNQRVEPEWYIPIIPTVLINGAEGIGTGWASKITNYDIREIISNIHRMLNGDEPLAMVRTGSGCILRLLSSVFLCTDELRILFFFYLVVHSSQATRASGAQLNR